MFQLRVNVCIMRIMAINAEKKLPLILVMSHENSPVPISLFKTDGELVSCQKSHFMQKLESFKYQVTTPIAADCLIFDANAVIQCIKPPNTAAPVHYKDMADQLIEIIRQTSIKVKNIHILFDHYFQDSIKQMTREKRGDTWSVSVSVRPDLQIPTNWKQFLHIGKNKESLIKSYTDHWEATLPSKLKGNETTFVSGGRETNTLKITCKGTELS